MSKLDMASIAKQIQNSFAKTDPAMAKKIGVGSDLSSPKDGPCIEMPDWWKEATQTRGLYFGRLAMIAGDSDSGKTSAAIVAMKCAVDQGCAVIYVETEGKTTIEDLKCWGLDPSQIILVKSSIAEEAFELMFKTWDAIKGQDPDAKILVVYDSIGNTVSIRDSEINLTEQSQKPGGKGQINRLGLNKMVAKRDQDNAAILVINYTYDNIGSPGKTNAGGKAVNFFSSLTYQTTRKQWLEKTVKGKKVRYGAEVVWKLFKNHIDKTNPGPKEVILRITAEGIKLVGASDSPTVPEVAEG